MMMRGALAGCLVLALAGCTSMETAEELPEDHWSRSPAAVPFMRIGRGITNIVVSPLDVPATVVRVARDYDNFGYALVAGGAEGVGNMVVRILAGAAEILTFPIVYDPEPFYERDLGERAIRKSPDVIP